jgi:hypothetical protein
MGAFMIQHYELLRRLKNLLISLDQLLYSIITLGGGDPDETCSSAAWRMECDGKFFGFLRPVIDTLFFWDKDHCKESYKSEVVRNLFMQDRYTK